MTIKYSEMECPQCFITFMIPERMEQARQSDKRAFYCPVGHSLQFGGQTDAEKLNAMRQERDRLKQQLAEKDDAIREARESGNRQVAAAKGQITRLKNRAAAGVCPCCNRSFENLRRHMTTKHPTFTAEGLTQ